MKTKEDQKQETREETARRKVVSAVEHLEGNMERIHTIGKGVTGFKIRGPEYEFGDYLCVINAVAEDGLRVVAFHNATSLKDCLAGAGHRLRNGSLKWYEDKYQA